MTAKGLEAAAKATAAVFVGGVRKGSATLVSDRHLLTAAHVVSNASFEKPIKVCFPAARDGAERHAASRVELSPAAADADVAVLDLGEKAMKCAPNPAAVWPAGRLPIDLSIYGFPLGEKALKGVWRESTLGGPAGVRVQLDWERGVGSLAGHSGGPVVDRDSGALVGVLVEGSEEAKFDRLVTVTTVRQYWDGLPRPSLFAGEDARGHFDRRAHGQRSVARGGDLFRGRRVALDVVDGWMRSDAAPG